MNGQRADRPQWGVVRFTAGAVSPPDVYQAATWGTAATPGAGALLVDTTDYASFSVVPADKRKVALHVYAPGALIPSELPLVQEA